MGTIRGEIFEKRQRVGCRNLRAPLSVTGLSCILDAAEFEPVRLARSFLTSAKTRISMSMLAFHSQGDVGGLIAPQAVHRLAELHSVAP